MTPLDLQDANILDAETINWRRIVYPVVGGLVVLLVVLGLYYYQQSQRDAHEAEARQAMLPAKTPEALLQVAEKYPHTTQADLAVLSAADLSFQKKDYAAAISDYHKVADSSGADATLRDSARLGLASTLEANNKIDEAIHAYLDEARLGNHSPYAPFAYISAARLYEDKNDKDDERKILTEAAGLGGDSPFLKEADYKLKALNASSQTPGSATPPPRMTPVQVPVAPQPSSQGPTSAR